MLELLEKYGKKITVNNYYTKGKKVKVQTGQGSAMNDHSTIFNLHNCTISLQGNLNELARILKKDKQDDEDAGDLFQAAEQLEKVQQLIPADGAEPTSDVKNEIRKKGLLNLLKAICDDLNDENSELYKKAAKVKRAMQTAQLIAKQYNDIAQWFGLPQVPKPFLGDHGKGSRVK